jgi:predicted dehydrogenase
VAGRSLGIGFVGAGFMNRFHVQSLLGVRDCHVAGVFSPTRANAEALAAQANSIGLGDARVLGSVSELIADPGVDALWVATTNDVRVAVVEEIVDAVTRGAGELRGVAMEKPLARNLREAKRIVELIESTPLLHGYLENQVFEPAVTRGREIIYRRAVPIVGRPYLARAAEEHSGPHMPWFWDGVRQGGGVLNDMMCHSYEVARFLLTAPGEPRGALTVEAVNAQIASLKWTRREYSELLSERMAGVDYGHAPAEDFARAAVQLRGPQGERLLVEATTSWSFVGPALRLRCELLGPEYAMQVDSLQTDLSIFLSRRVTGAAGEDLVEKQNAEQGLMPVIADEAGVYGYTAENRHMVQAFLDGRMPDETWRDGLAVTEVLMACYKSAEERRTIDFPADLTDFVPQVARGAWRGD